MNWANYYVKVSDGVDLLSSDFKRAIEENVKFEEWEPGMPLPFFERDVGLRINNLVCEYLFLDSYEKSCVLSDCSIGELIVEDMDTVESINSFVGNILCCWAKPLNNLLCNSVLFDITDGGAKSSFFEAGIPTSCKRRGDSYYGLNPHFEVRIKEPFRREICKPNSLYLNGGKLPPLPKHTLRLDTVFDWDPHMTTLNLSGWDTRKIVSFQSVFYKFISLAQVDLSDWDTSNAKYLRNMFFQCESLTSLDLSKWNTSKVVNAESMFFSCAKLKSLNLSGWDVSKVSDMSRMFGNCYGLESLNLSGWNIYSLMNISGAFFGCKNLTSLDLSGWDVSNVKFMNSVFTNCESLRTLNLSGWDVSNNIYTDGMFAGCSDLIVTVDASQLDKFNSLNHVPETVTFVTK